MSGKDEGPSGGAGEAKILLLNELGERLRSLEAQGKKVVVLCHGVFDHPGDVRHLEAAKRLGDDSRSPNLAVA